MNMSDSRGSGMTGGMDVEALRVWAERQMNDLKREAQLLRDAYPEQYPPEVKQYMYDADTFGRLVKLLERQYLNAGEQE